MEGPFRIQLGLEFRHAFPQDVVPDTFAFADLLIVVHLFNPPFQTLDVLSVRKCYGGTPVPPSDIGAVVETK